VFILKGVKVVCFDTLLQVLILKEVIAKSGGCSPTEEMFITEFAEGADVGETAKAGRDRLGWPKFMSDSTADRCVL
jgi:hypothetical protein